MNAQFFTLPYQADSSIYFSRIAHQPGAVFLDSGRPQCQLGRYDICTAWPQQSLQLQPGENLEHFLDAARQLLPAKTTTQFPFAGGLIGYLGYSAAIPFSRHRVRLPAARIGVYLWALITDHQQHNCTLVFHPQMNPQQRRQIIRLFEQQVAGRSEEFSLAGNFRASISKQQYLEDFAQIQQHIRQQDCQQVNYAQKFYARYHGSHWQAYRILRRACPVPYASYLRLGDDSALLSASPEQFLQVQQQQLQTWPIKGTRPRGSNAQQDQQLALELSNSSKDRNENLMIVELMRREFASCCIEPSIHTPVLCQLTSFANVHHLLSCVRGRLKPGFDGLHALHSCFVPGSISGTPKPAALQIIDELESSSRELYCGSVFYLDSSGAMDSSVCIRSLVANQGTLSCWGGGGITGASDAQAEYQESLDKVQVLLQALEQHQSTTAGS